MIPLWIIGGGGHAKLVIDTARTSGLFNVVGVLDRDAKRLGDTVLGVPIRDDYSMDGLSRHRVEHAVIAVGDNRSRAEIAKRLVGAVRWATVIHPSAILASGVEIGVGTAVFAGAIIQPDTTVGNHAILGTACSVGHDCVVGDYVHVGPGARLTGGVQLGEGVFIGAGAVVVPGRRIEAWTIVGAGAVVVLDLPSGVTARGVPARYVSR